MASRAGIPLAGRGTLLRPLGSGGYRRSDARHDERRCRVVTPAVTGPPRESWGGNNLEDLSLPEGDYGWPVLGETVEFLKDQAAFGEEHVKKYGTIFKSHVYGAKTIFITGKSALKKLTRLEATGKIHVRMLTPGLKVFGPGSLLALNGMEHANLRKLLFSAFSKDSVAASVPYIVNIAKKACASFEGRGYFPMAEELRRYAFNVTVSCFLGMEFPSRSIDEVVKLLNSISEGIYAFGVDLPFTTFGKAMKSREEMKGVIEDSIRLLEARRAEDDLPVRALRRILDARDENGKGLEMSVIIDTIILILYAGYDTFASSTDTLLHALELNPQIWEKLREEQQRVVESFGEEITSESLAAMPYAEAVVKEGLRFQPTLKFVFKWATETFELEGYRVPKDWQICLGYTFTMRYLDDTWSDAATFRPERFLEEGAEKMETYFPFGIGAHSCLGKELALIESRVILAVLARGYEVKLKNPRAPVDMFPVPHTTDGCIGEVRKLPIKGVN